MEKKRVLGQFFTKSDIWLLPQIVDFIVDSRMSIVYDPFAGDGDLLRTTKEICGLSEARGLDIDDALPWEKNDSLIKIPKMDNAIIVTNPPYFSNYSAARKGMRQQLSDYFKESSYSNLYMIALDRMLETQEYVVAIIPETFINSNYRQKERLHSITVVEKNPFNDTDTPVLVACFNGEKKSLSKIKVYKDETFIDFLGEIECMRMKPKKNVEVKFNQLDGWLAVRCVDTTNPKDMIRFANKGAIDYDWSRGIKRSSRLLTIVDVQLPEDQHEELIKRCNQILAELRKRTSDIILSPFKGNRKDGIRRRRLDFMTCRAIIEKAYEEICDKNNVKSSIDEKCLYARLQNAAK